MTVEAVPLDENGRQWGWREVVDEGPVMDKKAQATIKDKILQAVPDRDYDAMLEQADRLIDDNGYSVDDVYEVINQIDEEGGPVVTAKSDNLATETKPGLLEKTSDISSLTSESDIAKVSEKTADTPSHKSAKNNLEGVADSSRTGLNNVDGSRKIPVIDVGKGPAKGHLRVLRGMAKIAARRHIGKHKNQDTGWTISLSGKGASHVAEDHFEEKHYPAMVSALSKLSDIAKHAVRIETHADEKQQKGVKQRHRLYAPVKIGSDVYTVKLTVKEKSEGFAEVDDFRIYALRSEKKKPSGNLHASPEKDSDSSWPALGIDKTTIQDMLEGVNDNNGKPFFSVASRVDDGVKSTTVDAEENSDEKRKVQTTGGIRSQDGKREVAIHEQRRGVRSDGKNRKDVSRRSGQVESSDFGSKKEPSPENELRDELRREDGYYELNSIDVDILRLFSPLSSERFDEVLAELERENQEKYRANYVKNLSNEEIDDPVVSHIMGRLDGKSLRDWPGLYRLLSKKFGQRLFRSQKKGGIGIDELAAETNSLGLFEGDSDALVEYLKEAEGVLQRRENFSFSLSASDTPTKGMRVKAVELAVRTLQRTAKNALPLKVVKSVSDLPQHIQEEAQSRGKGYVEAANDGKSVYIVADNVSSRRRAIALWMHEQGIHTGLKELLGLNYRQMLNQVYLAAGGKKAFRDIAERYEFDLDSRLDQMKAAEEYLASLAEKVSEGAALEGREISAWRRVVKTVAEWLRKMGIYINLTNSEIAWIVNESIRTTVHGQQRGEGESDLNPAVAFAQKHRDALKKALVEAANGNLEDVDFGKLSRKKIQKLNLIRSRLGQPIVQENHLIIPGNVVRKLYNERMVKGKMSADEVADLVYSIFHAKKSKVVAQKAHDHIQALVNMREELSRLGFIGHYQNKAVVKTGFKEKSKRVPKRLAREKRAVGGRDIPPSGSTKNGGESRQTSRFSDLHGPLPPDEKKKAKGNLDIDTIDSDGGNVNLSRAGGKPKPSQGVIAGLKASMNGTLRSRSKSVEEIYEAPDRVEAAVESESNRSSEEILSDIEETRSFATRLFRLRDHGVYQANRKTNILQQKIQRLAGSVRKRKGPFAYSDVKDSKKARRLDQAMLVARDVLAHPEKVEEFREWADEKLSDPRTKRQERARIKRQLDLVDAAMDLTKEQREFLDNEIEAAFREVGQKAKKAGLIRELRDNYVRRIWDFPKDVIVTGATANYGFKVYTSASKQRTLETILDGWMAGYELKVKSISNSFDQIATEVAVIEANKAFIKIGQQIKDSKKTPLFTTSKVDGYEPLKASGFSVWTVAGNVETVPLEYMADYQLEVNNYGQRVFLSPPKDDKVTLFERKQLNAPRNLAEMLNKMTQGDNLFRETPGLDSLLRFNAGVKGWILLSSFFHHMAGARSWMFGVSKVWKTGKWNPVKAYKAGLNKVAVNHEIVSLGVKNGLTLGLQQDYDEGLLQQKGLTEKAMEKLGSQLGLKAVEAGRAFREMASNSLFKKFFAGLKAEAFVIEYTHELDKDPSADPDKVAERVARLINEDFGGLHLQRMGRNPTLQKVCRLLLLAPDWTESNFRTAFGMLPGDKLNKWIGKMLNDVPPPPGMEKVYRRFWGRVAFRAVLSTVLAQLLINGWSDDDLEDLWEFYKDQFSSPEQFSRLRWTMVDITKLYEALGIEVDPRKRKMFSVAGHFTDPLKLMNPAKLIKGKGSPVVRAADSAFTGSDWAERPFTGVKELVTTGKTIKKSRFNKKESFFDRLPATVINQVVSMQPIQVGQLLRYWQGEEDALSALMSSAGAHISNAWSLDRDKIKYQEYAGRMNAMKKLRTINRIDGAKESELDLLRNEYKKELNPRLITLYKRVQDALSRLRKRKRHLERHQKPADWKKRVAEVEEKMSNMYRRFNEQYEAMK